MVQLLTSFTDALIARLNQWQQRHPTVAFLHAVGKKYLDDEAGHRAALLAYYAFLAIFPLLLVLATVFRVWFHHDTALSKEVMQHAVDYFPAIGGELQMNVHAISQTGPTLLISIAITLFGARGVADVLRSSLDHIWQVPYVRRSRMPGALFRSLAIVVVAGLGLVATPVFFGYALAFAPNRIFSILSTTLTAFVLFWVLILVIKLGTSTPQPMKRIWVGATVALISLGLLQTGGSYVMAREIRHLDVLYGTFALVLGLIFWLYLQTQLLMIAFEIDAVRYFKLSPRSMNQQPTDADQEAYRLYYERGRFHDA